MKTFEETLSFLRSEGISLSNLMEGPLSPFWVAILRREAHLDRVGKGNSPVAAIEAALAVKDITAKSYKEYRDECARGGKVTIAETRDVLMDFMKR